MDISFDWFHGHRHSCDWIAAHNWCDQQFGKPGRKWTCYHISQNTMTFFFSDEKDKTLFILRWN